MGENKRARLIKSYQLDDKIVQQQEEKGGKGTRARRNA